MCDDLVLLALEGCITSCQFVIQARKTKHQAYHKTNALARRCPTHSISCACLERRSIAPSLEIVGERASGDRRLHHFPHSSAGKWGIQNCRRLFPISGRSSGPATQSGRADETIPAIVKQPENQATRLTQPKMLKFVASDAVAPSQPLDGAFKNL